jgi:serine/threonine-protein kinase
VWIVEQAGQVRLTDMVRQGLYKTSIIAAIIAWLLSRVVYKMGTAVNQARSMGAYRLEELLGKGGMGEVWRARHAVLKRPAAIKVIQPEKLGATGTPGRNATLQRFEREAQATANLNSTHTVKLYDFGSTDDGAFYYVMELLQGLDLETMIERFGPVRPERAVFLLRQICHSLMDAHDNGMIHRDIKPANVFVCRMGPDHDFVKVLDFGLVKQIDDLHDGDEGLTMEGVIRGTPAFMAPEMALRSNGAGPATDVYQVGCVGYWLLTGQLVFDGDTPMSVLSQHLQSEPVPVSQRTEIAIPQELERIIMDCLRKEQADRPQNARALSARLGVLELGDTWTQERAQQWWAAHRPGHA